METPKEIKEVLCRVHRTTDDLKKIKSVCPEILVGDMVNCLIDLSMDLKSRREYLLLKQARKDSSMQFRWSWWSYPISQTEDGRPRQEASSQEWHEYQIDAVTEACKDPCLCFRRDRFYVCLLTTDCPTPDSVKYHLYHCMAPWTKDGTLPTVGLALHPSHYGESEVSIDAVYKAHAEYATFDKWDGPSGVEFITMAPPGL